MVSPDAVNEAFCILYPRCMNAYMLIFQCPATNRMLLFFLQGETYVCHFFYFFFFFRFLNAWKLSKVTLTNERDEKLINFSFFNDVFKWNRFHLIFTIFKLEKYRLREETFEQPWLRCAMIKITIKRFNWFFHSKVVKISWTAKYCYFVIVAHRNLGYSKIPSEQVSFAKHSRPYQTG